MKAYKNKHKAVLAEQIKKARFVDTPLGRFFVQAGYYLIVYPSAMQIVMSEEMFNELFKSFKDKKHGK